MKKLFICFIFIYSLIYSEKPIVVVIPSYNNAPYYEQNLNSIINQKYSNFHVIYMNDRSTDGTGNLVQEYRKQRSLEDKITLINYPQRERKLKHIYEVIHSLDDWALVVLIDGDDWLAHNQVFSRINHLYQTQDVWFTYGQCIQSCKNGVTFAKALPEYVVKNGLFRKHEWVYSHLRTFYAWLFKQIRLADFLTEQSPGYKGKFHPGVDDVAFTFPMIEMARYHYKFFSDILYIYNSENPLSIGKTAGNLTTIGLYELKNKPAYQELFQPCIYKFNEKKAYPIILLFNQDQVETFKALQQISNNIKNAGPIIVLQDKPIENSLGENIIYLNAADSINIAHDLQKLLACYETEYILLGNSAPEFCQMIDLHEAICLLEKTKAYSFQLSVDDNYLRFLHHQPVFDVYCWKFNCNMQAKNLIHNINWTLYRKSDVLKALHNKKAQNIFDIEKIWQQNVVDMDNVSLFTLRE